MKSRGQAALEFLSTYGFAFLVILVMIGALSYFGVLSPGRFLPERCLVNSEFSCTEFQIDGTAETVSFVLQNNLGNTVNIDQSSVVVTSDFGDATGADCTFDPDPTQIAGGEEATIVCTLDSADGLPAAGEKIRATYTIQYIELGRTFDRTINGEVFATVQ